MVIVLWFLGIITILYLVLLTGIYFFQDIIMFQAKPLKPDYDFRFPFDYTEYFIDTPDGILLNALYFKTKHNSKGLVLYFHGNADNLQRWGNYSIDITSNGYDILMIDYRGFGKSTGTPSESSLHLDAQATLDWVSKNISYNKIVFYGRSLGTALASKLAVDHNPDLLILETPFDHVKGAMSDAIKPFYLPFELKYNFTNRDHIPFIKCPIIIFSGTKDWIVPLKSVLRLKQLLKEKDQFIIIKGGAHKNLRNHDKYQQKLKTVLV